jgi:hypothetical protein
MILGGVAVSMTVEEHDARLIAMSPAQRRAYKAALEAFEAFANQPVNILPDTPEFVALTESLRAPGFPEPVLLYPDTFTVRTRPGDFARWLARTTGTTYRCIR